MMQEMQEMQCKGRWWSWMQGSVFQQRFLSNCWFSDRRTKYMVEGVVEVPPSSSSSSSSLPRFLEDEDLHTNSKLQRQFKWAGLVERIEVGRPGLHKNLFKVRNFFFRNFYPPVALNDLRSQGAKEEGEGEGEGVEWRGELL